MKRARLSSKNSSRRRQRRDDARQRDRAPNKVELAEREWARANPRAVRALAAFDERQAEHEVRWSKRRRTRDEEHEEEERKAREAPPRTAELQRGGQETALKRGARSLLSPVDVWVQDDRSVIPILTASTARRRGPGRAALMAAPTTRTGSARGDWSRAELAWTAAILHLDFTAVYRALRRGAPRNAVLQKLVAAWPSFDQRPLLAELLGKGLRTDELMEELWQRTPRTPPPAELRLALALLARVGKGAHLFDAPLSVLDLEEHERATLPPGARTLRDLPERLQRRLLDRHAEQIHVRRILALPPERGTPRASGSLTAIVDLRFAGHHVGGRFSHGEAPPRRVVDIVSTGQVQLLYKFGPDRAALQATAMVVDRSLAVVRSLVRQAKVMGLVMPAITR